jgi:hypothetical protein
MNCGRWTDDGGCDDQAVCDKAVREADEADYRLMKEIEKSAQEYFQGRAA